jgi:flagellin
MIIQNNISALNTFRQMGVNNNSTAKSLEKLSSGLRINRAGDDAAGLAISEKMRSQVRGLNRASSNAQDGISLVQAADGALQELHAVMHRMRELAVQAADDTNERTDRQAIQDEINQLTKEIDRIANTTEFNKKTILDGSLSNGKFIKSLSGSNVSSISMTVQNDEFPLVNGMTSVSVVEAGQKFDMTFDFTPKVEPVQKNAWLHIAVSRDIALSAGIDFDHTGPIGITEHHPTFPVPVFEGDYSYNIFGRVRDMLENLLGDDWTVTSSEGKVKVESNYVGRFGGCNNNHSIPAEKIWGAFHVFAAHNFDAATDNVDWADDIWTPFEWDTGEPYAPFASLADPSHPTRMDPRTSNVQGTIGKDMRIKINGQEPTFTNKNFTPWEDHWTNSGYVSAGIDSANTGILRGRDAYIQLYLGDGTGEVQREQFSFRITDPTKTSNAVIATDDGSDLTLQVGANTGHNQTVRIAIGSLSAVSLGVSSLNVVNHNRAQSALTAIDGGIQTVSEKRAALGAIQNRLEHTMFNLGTVSENLQDAESRVRDVDMAKEIMGFTKHAILMQASHAMMAQANSLPQGVLQLLR